MRNGMKEGQCGEVNAKAGYTAIIARIIHRQLIGGGRKEFNALTLLETGLAFYSFIVP